jgi:hypothetical protein
VIVGSDTTATDDPDMHDSELRVLRKGFARVTTAAEICAALALPRAADSRLIVEGRAQVRKTMLRFQITLSADGYAAGPNQSVDHPLGEGGEMAGRRMSPTTTSTVGSSQSSRAFREFLTSALTATLFRANSRITAKPLEPVAPVMRITSSLSRSARP